VQEKFDLLYYSSLCIQNKCLLNANQWMLAGAQTSHKALLNYCKAHQYDNPTFITTMNDMERNKVLKKICDRYTQSGSNRIPWYRCGIFHFLGVCLTVIAVSIEVLFYFAVFLVNLGVIHKDHPQNTGVSAKIGPSTSLSALAQSRPLPLRTSAPLLGGCKMHAVYCLPFFPDF